MNNSDYTFDDNFEDDLFFDVGDDMEFMGMPEAGPMDMSAEDHISMGRVYITSNRFEEALLHLNEAISLEAKNGDAFFLRGTVHFHLGNNDEAQEDFAKALRAGAEEMKVLNFTGCLKARAGDFEGANADLANVEDLSDLCLSQDQVKQLNEFRKLNG